MLKCVSGRVLVERKAVRISEMEDIWEPVQTAVAEGGGDLAPCDTPVPHLQVEQLL